MATGPAWNPHAELAAATPDRANAALGKSDLPNAAFGRIGRPVVAVAGGAAFTFGYAEHAELLAAAGCEVAVVNVTPAIAPFSPLLGRSVPGSATPA